MSIRAITWAKGVIEAHDLTHSQRLALLCLACHHHDATGACFPSMESIGLFAGLSERRARTAVRDLEAMGLVSAFKRVTRKGQSSNHYDLFGAYRRADKKSRPRPDASVRPVGGTAASGDREEILMREESPSRMRVIQGGRS